MSVADLHRRAEISRRSNERYLDALSVVEDAAPCAEIFDRVAKPVRDARRGLRARPLRIGDTKDVELLAIVARGEFAIAGFRNRDLAHLLQPGRRMSAADRRRTSAQMGRRLRMLRAHGVIKKVPKTHRYQITERGRLLAAAVQATREEMDEEILAPGEDFGE